MLKKINKWRFKYRLENVVGVSNAYEMSLAKSDFDIMHRVANYYLGSTTLE